MNKIIGFVIMAISICILFLAFIADLTQSSFRKYIPLAMLAALLIMVGFYFVAY